jgi:hypothetical protein
MLLKPKVLLSLLVAISVGYMLSEILSGYQYGFIEFGTFGAIFVMGNIHLTQSTGYEIILPGYALSWVGHFFFERNVPASWIYPIYSFLGDYRMCYDTITDTLNNLLN